MQEQLTKETSSIDDVIISSRKLQEGINIINSDFEIQENIVPSSKIHLIKEPRSES